MQASDVCGSLEIDCAIEVVRSLGREIDGYKGEVRAGRLMLQPDETVSDFLGADTCTLCIHCTLYTCMCMCIMYCAFVGGVFTPFSSYLCIVRGTYTYITTSLSFFNLRVH